MEIQINTAEPSVLARFLERCDDSFVPPLSSRVAIESYAQKLANHATRFEAWERGEGLIGLAAVYCGHEPVRPAFLTSISVLPGWVGQGLGARLIETVLEELARKGFEHLDLETSVDNLRALRFYERLGFQRIRLQDSTITLRRTLSPTAPPTP